jgi:polysaccharide export outer membrane protein
MKTIPHKTLTTGIGRLSVALFGLLAGTEAPIASAADSAPVFSALVSSNYPASTVAHSAALTPADKQQLAVGDRISFRIQEDLDDPKEPLEPKALVVADSGEIEVPYIGRVRAEHKTCQQLAAEIKTALEREYYYQATVVIALDLRARTRGRVYLVGPVRTPGEQDIPSDEPLTLSKAIMRAGGFNDFADKKSVKVTRKGGSGESDKTFVVDVTQVLEKGKTERDLTLEPGDLILVSERTIRF